MSRARASSRAAAAELRQLEADACQAIVLGDFQAALPVLCRLVLRAPPGFEKLPPALVSLAHAYVQLGRPSDAIRVLSRAIEIAPDLELAHVVWEMAEGALGE